MGAANGGTVSVSLGAKVLLPATAVTSDTWTLPTPIALSEADGTTGALVVTAKNTLGNPKTFTVNLTVDVTPPPAPGAVMVTQNSGTAHAPKFHAAWTTSVGASNYDIRWSDITAKDGGVEVGDDKIYYDATRSEEASGALLPAGAVSYDLDRSAAGTSLPPNNTYYFQVRAVDAVGNESVLAAPVTLSSNMATTTYASPGGNAVGQFNIAAGNFRQSSGPAVLDVVIASHVSSQIYLYTNTSGPGALVESLLYSGAVDDALGTDVSAGNVVDGSGSARADLLVGASASSTPGGIYDGYAALFLGVPTTGLPTTPDVLFEGGSGAGAAFGDTARVIGDVNGDGIDDIYISAPNLDPQSAQEYIFFGRSRLAWLRGGAKPAHYALSDASLVIASRTSASNPANNLWFGDFGVTDLGDLDGDQKHEFGFANPYSAENQFYVFKGQALNATPLALSTAVQTLSAPTGWFVPSGPYFPDGLGGAAAGNVNVTGTAAKDLFISMPVSSLVGLWVDGSGSGFSAQPKYAIGGPGHFGTSLKTGDIDGDGKVDFAAGDGVTDVHPRSSAWVLYNTGATVPFDAQAAGGLHQSQLTTGAAGFQLGRSLTVADLNGDGKADIIAADPGDPIAPNVGKNSSFTIWY